MSCLRFEPKRKLQGPVKPPRYPHTSIEKMVLAMVFKMQYKLTIPHTSGEYRKAYFRCYNSLAGVQSS